MTEPKPNCMGNWSDIHNWVHAHCREVGVPHAPHFVADDDPLAQSVMSGEAWNPNNGPHTRAVETGGNPYCVECSAAIQAWVAYPCRDWLSYDSPARSAESAPQDGTRADEALTGGTVETLCPCSSPSYSHLPSQHNAEVVVGHETPVFGTSFAEHARALGYASPAQVEAARHEARREALREAAEDIAIARARNRLVEKGRRASRAYRAGLGTAEALVRTMVEGQVVPRPDHAEGQA